MTAAEIRQLFLDFFEKKQHKIVPSAPLVVKNDPTLMFTNAGMNQFKDYFLGNKVPPATRIADTQKCLRVSGKHNDLEEVGIDTYHHTMFEMLGNWSFGDYFKKEALEWSWELLTEVYKLPKDRLYATVFGGDEKEGLAPDTEALEIWKTMLPESQILFGNKKDNFWEMGDTGPCGPCSEIHIDMRSEDEIKKKAGRELVNADDPQVIEIWNNVFIQFERINDGSLRPLPAQHVDTGMGFERLVRAIQGKTSNYDTDVFTPLLDKLATLSGIPYGKDEKTAIAMRVCADHVRAVAFAIADGQLPANNGAGYVIRRILRRAIRYGYTFLGFKTPFMCELVPTLAEQMKNVFPELAQQTDFVAKVFTEEENSFLRTLETGLKRIEQITAEMSGKVIDGKVVFELYDTFGFPTDLTALIAREKGLSIDEKGFEAEMKQQKDRSRAATATATGDWVVILPELTDTEFIGYENLSATAQITKYRKVSAKGKDLFQFVLNKTPFYAESGGQVGDKGFVLIHNKTVEVIDTKKENDLIVHFTTTDLGQFELNEKTYITAQVEVTSRIATTANHSATHLLHAALRRVLGSHVAQKGSLVNQDVLRFDFSHFAKMTDEEIAQVEQIVNQKIRENIALNEQRNVPIEKAKAMGAMALFGEKYGEFVRVITFDADFSVELCGGTHVKATGEIGLFKIIAESSVSAGVRRIEAITAQTAENYVAEQEKLLQDIKELLKNPKDVRKALTELIEEKQQAQKQIEAFRHEQNQQIKKSLLGNIQMKNEMSIIIAEVPIDTADGVKQVAFELRQQVEHLLLVLAAVIDGKPHLAVMLSDDIVAKGINAANLVRDLAKEIQGGGGGQPFFATAGGKNIDGIKNAIKKAKEMFLN
jgi:alanyl-tRNA synthetase